MLIFFFCKGNWGCVLVMLAQTSRNRRDKRKNGKMIFFLYVSCVSFEIAPGPYMSVNIGIPTSSEYKMSLKIILCPKLPQKMSKKFFQKMQFPPIKYSRIDISKSLIKPQKWEKMIELATEKSTQHRQNEC